MPGKRGFGPLRSLPMVAAGLAFLFACRAEPGGKAVASVGRERLMLDGLRARIPIQLARGLTPQEKRRLAEEWVEEELLYQEALRRGLDKDPAISGRLSRAVHDLLVSELLEREVGHEDEVSDSDVAAYYHSHRDEFVREHAEVKARHILVRDRDALNRAWRRLQAREPFAQVAREESVDASAEDGGDLGNFREGQVNASFWEVCQQAPIGRPVQETTNLGHHIVEVLERREAGSPRSLEEARKEVRQRLLTERRNAKRQALVEGLRKQLSWSISEEALAGDSAKQP